MWLFEIMDDVAWIVPLLVVLVLTYVFLNWKPNVWKRQGVPGPTSYPFFGTSLDLIKKGQRVVDRERYEKYGTVWGTIERGRPSLVVGDEEMLRDVMVKKFNHFVDRKGFFLSDEISENMLISLRGDAWRRVRHLLTPTFSTGKLKMMMTSMTECCDLMMGNLAKTCDQKEDFECKKLFSAYTMDIIARTGFGIKVDTQTDPDNEFVTMAMRAFSPRFIGPIAILSLFFPWILPIARLLGLGLFDVENRAFFTRIVEEIMDRRKSGDKAPKDLVQLMLNAHEEEVDAEAIATEVNELGQSYDASTSQAKKGLSKKELVAQGFLLLNTGYETTATTISMLAYCMACNPHCQEKLYEELVKEYGKEGSVDYQSMNNVAYLNMCIDETLRLYPPAGRADRIASEDTQIGGIHVPKDSVIIIPIIGIHYDEKIYPQPEKFDPERFSAEAKASRSPLHHLPFGYGPRSCIGMRLAQTEVRLAAIHMFRKYRFLPCSRTEVPLQLSKSFFLNSKNGIWLKVAQRE